MVSLNALGEIQDYWQLAKLKDERANLAWVEVILQSFGLCLCIKILLTLQF